MSWWLFQSMVLVLRVFICSLVISNPHLLLNTGISEIHLQFSAPPTPQRKEQGSVCHVTWFCTSYNACWRLCGLVVALSNPFYDHIPIHSDLHLPAWLVHKIVHRTLSFHATHGNQGQMSILAKTYYCSLCNYMRCWLHIWISGRNGCRILEFEDSGENDRLLQILR